MFIPVLYIFQFQKSHLFIFSSFSPCLFLCFIKHIDIRGLRSSSANSNISVISEPALNELFLKNVLWVTFLSFGNSNNFLVGCWASLSSPLPGRTSEVNNQNTPRNQGIVLDELNKVVSLGYLHSVQNVFLWWPNDELLFWFSSFSSKLPWSHLACLIPHLHHTSAVAILSDFLFHPSVSFKMAFACLKWEKWERIAV